MIRCITLWRIACITIACSAAVDNPKRGFGGVSSYAQVSDMMLLAATSWWYDWGLTTPSSEFNNAAQEFVPMLWGKGSLAKLDGFAPGNGTTSLLGFNEPNLHTQSNLTATAACELWPTVLEAAKKHGLKVGSPAANYCIPKGNGTQDSSCFQSPTDWFDEFFAADGCGVDTVDFIATHKYGCNATALVEYVQSLSARYQKPVWLTEFSCSESSPEKQLAFQQEALPQLDALESSVLERYAWFAARTYQNPHQQNAGTTKKQWR